MAKLFIDTNVYLDFYRSNHNSIKVLESLKNYANKYLVFPEQVYIEFRRNRANKITEAINKVNNLKYTIPSFLTILDGVNSFVGNNEANQKELDELKKIMKEMISTPQNDPIFRDINHLYHHSAYKILRTDNNIQRAIIRNKLGDPPKSSGKDTIGDEVIWESILSELKDDLVIVSRDNTFENFIDILSDEYFEKTGKKILQVTKSISAALKTVGEEQSKEIVNAETEQLDLLTHYGSPGYYSASYTFPLDTGAAIPLINWWNRPQNEVAVAPQCSICGNYGPWQGNICLSCGIKKED